MMQPRLVCVFCDERGAPEVVAEHQRVRRQIFVVERGWELQLDDDRERDQFDTPATLYAVLFADDAPVGGFRACRTDRPYLSANVFPQLATLRPYPARQDVWEVSRFGLIGCCASELAPLNYALMFHLAHHVRASALVAVADEVYERYLRLLGIRTRRYGPPQVIGRDRFGNELTCIAGEIVVAEQAGSRFSRVLSELKNVEIQYATDVFRPSAISA